MNSQEMIAWSVAGLLICNIVTLLMFGIVAVKLSRIAGRLEKDAGPAIHTIRETVVRVESLAESAEQLVRQSVAPTFSDVHEATQSFRQSAGNVRRVVGRMEDALAKPIALLAAAGNALDTPTGKAGLLALTLGLARYKRIRHDAKTRTFTEPISAGRTNGASKSHN